MRKPLTGAYYYPGWHPCPVRDGSFPRGWSEWDLVRDCKPRFEGHNQPKKPLWGFENEALPEVFAKKLAAAQNYGVDFFVFAYYWSRGKRLLEGALNEGFLKAENNEKTRFALMWANRMPRKVMPVKDAQARLIDPSRLVFTDPADFVEFIDFVSDKYFSRPNYLRIDGANYLSIFDTAFFIKQLGIEAATNAVSQARALLSRKGLQMHLVAIDPIPEHRPVISEIGFDSVTHYVFLPDWNGDYQQDFNDCVEKKYPEWEVFQNETGLPYSPSVSPGWDANPRAADYGKEKPGRYPWSPIVTASSPAAFADFLKRAVEFAINKSRLDDPMVLISSWNEWSEGHYLEPDEEYGFAWLEAIKNINV